MTRVILHAQDRRIKALLLAGCSRKAIIQQVGISKSALYVSINRLQALGEIRRVPGTKSPMVFEDPKNPRGVLEASPKGDGILESTKTAHPSENNGSPPSVSDDDDKPIGIPLDLVGISTEKKCPPGYGAVHMTGAIVFTVRKVGTFDDIRDNGGFVIGYWSNPTSSNMKGVKEQHRGMFRYQNQDVGFEYRLTSKGKHVFMLYPARIYVDPHKFTDSNECMALLIDRALYVTDALRASGWQLTDPKAKGDLHLAFPDHPLVQHFDNRLHLDDGDLIVDTSPGTPEMEFEHLLEDPQGMVKARLMADLPTRFLTLEAKEGADSAAISRHEDAIGILSERLSGLQQIAVQLVDLTERQSMIFERQVRINTSQAQINVGAAPIVQTPSPETESVQAHKFERLEGYQ